MNIPELEILRSLVKSIDNMARLPESLWTEEITLIYTTLCNEVLIYQQVCRNLVNPTEVHIRKTKEKEHE